MNGVTDGYAEWLHENDCPFCGHVLDGLYCGNCVVTFTSRADVERQRRLDYGAYMADRAAGEIDDDTADGDMTDADDDEAELWASTTRDMGG
jgi:hypothetical protein